MVKSKTRIHNGFTLVELLVVMSIVSLLIAILLPALSKSRDSATTITCASKMRQVGSVLNNYQVDYKGFIPAGDQLFVAGVPVNNGNKSWNTGMVELQNYGSGLVGQRWNDLVICPSDRRFNRRLLISGTDMRDVSYQFPGYIYTGAFSSQPSYSVAVIQPMKPDSLHFKNPRSAGLSKTLAFVEDDENTTNGYGRTSPTLQYSGPAVSTYYGTYVNWYYMFRHNSDRGMNLLWLDGHCSFAGDYQANFDQFASASSSFYW